MVGAKTKPDSRWARDMAIARRVSQIPPDLYPVFRLIALMGPTDDAGVVLRAKSHGVRRYRHAVAACRRLEREGILKREAGLWSVTYERLV